MTLKFNLLRSAEMEIIPEGKKFRLVHDDELPSILKVLEKHLPYALKVSAEYFLRLGLGRQSYRPKHRRQNLSRGSHARALSTACE